MRRGKPPALPRRRCEAAIARCRGTRSDYTGDYNRNYLTGGVPRASTRTPRGNGRYYREEQDHAGTQKQRTVDTRKTARGPAVGSPIRSPMHGGTIRDRDRKSVAEGKS